MQLQLFPNSTSRPCNDPIEIRKIRGLQYIADYITEQEEQKLIKLIDLQEWDCTLQRRVQHYGYKYDYKARRVIKGESYLGPLPLFLDPLVDRIKRDSLMQKRADQVIINEYKKGQGISHHVDCEPCFKNTIISLSLGSSCIMTFKLGVDNINIPFFLERRSLILLKDDARYKYMHGIPARKTDTWTDGNKYKRDRRISLTFREVIL